MLLVKISSLGDVLHAMPALEEAAAKVPGLRCDWVVEEAYAPLVRWHGVVHRTIPVALRRWRRRPGPGALRELSSFIGELRSARYDLVLDAQGLLKSAAIARLAHGVRAGFDRSSAREPVAALAYQRSFAVPAALHAVERQRQLFAAALGYTPGAEPPGFGLRPGALPPMPGGAYVVLLHGTTWDSKRWPDAYWPELAARIAARGLRTVLPWGNAQEHGRALAIAAQAPHTSVLPPLGLMQLAAVLKGARAAVGVDTGLAHLAGALGVPTLTLYGATDPARTGTWGSGQAHLAASFACAPCLRRVCPLPPAAVHPPCFGTLAPATVDAALGELLAAPR